MSVVDTVLLVSLVGVSFVVVYQLYALLMKLRIDGGKK